MPTVESVKSPEQPKPSLINGYALAVLRNAWRAVVFVLGISVVLVGIVMIVAPGPAVVVIPLGIGILATEFLWARRILELVKERVAAARASASQAPLPRWMRVFLPRSSRGE